MSDPMNRKRVSMASPIPRMNLIIGMRMVEVKEEKITLNRIIMLTQHCSPGLVKILEKDRS